MKSFPKPLSACEEAYYLKQCKTDETAKHTLIEHNLRLVAHVAKKYNFSNEDMEDLLSIGTIGLIKAINTFDCTKNCRLATYAARCIDNELLMYFRNGKKRSKNVSLYEPIGTDKEGNDICLLDVFIAEDSDIFAKVTLQDDIHCLYRLLQEKLTQRERYVISLRYGLFNLPTRTQQEIADALGISRSYVSRIEKNALKKLRGGFF
ncbi:MAG: RNA polymerase sporulation sigma factor SigK [Lachnospiraceae bacterium]|nr:RNA polymerase sporulation sigma factor SigK [Lachnospiraceae bacterium]